MLKAQIAVLSLVALSVTGCMTTTQQLAISSADQEALYLSRYNAQLSAAQKGGGLESYDPLETVRGASEHRFLAVTEKPEISADALQNANTFAADRNSSAFIVWRDGKIQTERYWQGFTRDTPIVSKSLAKPVTALLIGRAIAQGYIMSLDQPVSDYITEWKGDPVKQKILIRHLLDMRSGLLPQGQSTGPDHVLNRAYLHPRHDEIIISEYPVTDEPGTRYEYSNANSELISPIIERATGKRYGEYLSEALLEPIGAQGGSIWLNRPGGVAHSGCCLLLPAQSWLRMAILLINDGVWQGKRLLPKGYVSEMRTPTSQNVYAGLGIWIAGNYTPARGSLNPLKNEGKTTHKEPYAAKDLYLFDGNANQVVYMVPSDNLVILRTGGWSPKDKPWDNSYLPNVIIEGIIRKAGEKMPEPQPRAVR
jgi:CubicO group peptidase (beta-lactamase class C family)